MTGVMPQHGAQDAGGLVSGDAPVSTRFWATSLNPSRRLDAVELEPADQIPEPSLPDR